MSNFSLNPELSVVCFRRENSKQGPFFAVREFDTKVLRTRDKGRGRGRGPSEQAIRASIRQAILNMNLKSERATKAEIRLLKGHGILGKRAPSCSLLCAEDMIKLLEAFGKDDLVRDLRVALAKDKKLSPPVDDYRTLKTSQKIRKTSKIKTPPQESAEAFSGKRQRLDSPSRMDTLLSALLALSNTDSSVESTSSLSSLSPVSSSSPISPSKTPEAWSFPSPKLYEIPSPPSPSLRIRDMLPDAESVPKPIPLSSLSTGLSFSTPTPSVLRPKKSRRLKTNPQRNTLSPPSIKVDTRRSYLPVSHISPPVSPLSSVSSVGSYDEIGSREEPSTPDSVNFQPTPDSINFQFLPLPLESLALLSSLDPASLCSPQGFAPIQGLTEFQGLSTPAVSGHVESPGFSGFLEPKDQGLTQVLDHT